MGLAAARAARPPPPPAAPPSPARGVTFLVPLVAALLEDALASGGCGPPRHRTAAALVGRVRVGQGGSRSPSGRPRRRFSRRHRTSTMTWLPFPDRGTEASTPPFLERLAEGGRAARGSSSRRSGDVVARRTRTPLKRLSREVRAGARGRRSSRTSFRHRSRRYIKTARGSCGPTAVGFTARDRHPASRAIDPPCSGPIAYAVRGCRAASRSPSATTTAPFPLARAGATRRGPRRASRRRTGAASTVHARMASVARSSRGAQIVRATRWACRSRSPTRRIRGWRSAVDPGDGVMLV